MSTLHGLNVPRLALLVVLLLQSTVRADPLLSSWFTEGSTKYARIYTSTANRAAGISTTTWTEQTSPTYAGVHEIDYSSGWVYIKNTGLAPYIMGPWNNPNHPRNQGTSTGVYRFPRSPSVISSLATTGRTLTGQGSIGFLVDGVAIYNTSDGFSYSTINNQDASPQTKFTGLGQNGDGIWNRDAWPNEGGSFDFPLNHPQPSGQYHAHANPIGIRYVLGDNINYNSSTKFYSENTSATDWKHSPIIGWINDGLPLYGPYGYSNPTDPTSSVRRMVSGYIFRDGTHGTTDLISTGRKGLPLWAQQAQNKTTLTSSQWGPNVSTDYELGHFSEDYDYLGDLGYSQGADFDLNKYNARYCVTPEYP
ncbi:MAG: YHYH protein, partial [Verrucomicrobiota bacterium]